MKRVTNLVHFGDIKLPKAAPMLVRDFIPKGGIAVIWGAPKCRKSFIALDLSMHVALDRPWCGRTVSGGPVVYFALEGAFSWPARIEAVKKKMLADCAEVPEFWLSTLPIILAADKDAIIAEVRATLCKRLPALVVIDTVNQSIPGSDSDDDVIRAFGKAARAVSEAFGCAVIVVHHCGWNNERMRGSRSMQAIEDAEIAAWKDEHDENNSIIEVVAARDFAEGAIVAFRRDVVEVGIAENGDTITSLVMTPVDLPAGASRSAPTPKRETERGIFARMALEALRDLTLEKGARIARQDIPASVRCVKVEDWKKHAEMRGLIDDDTTKDAAKKRWQRVRTDLFSAGQIAFNTPYVWLVKQ